MRETQDTPALDRARIYLAGEVIVGKTPQEAREMVAKVAATKPDIIKIRVDDNLGNYGQNAARSLPRVIDEAHRLGLRVAAHIFYLEDAKDLLRAGADFIAHSVRDKELDAEFISLMKQRNIPYCPTLTRELSTFVVRSNASVSSLTRSSCAKLTARWSPNYKNLNARRPCAKSPTAQGYRRRSAGSAQSQASR
jgi:imidazolonepropionase-like amidohydrolase